MKKFLFALVISISLPFHTPIIARGSSKKTQAELTSKWPLNAKQTVVLIAIVGILFYVSPIKLLLQIIALCGFFFVIRNRAVIAHAAKNRDVAALQQLVPKLKEDGTNALSIAKNFGQESYNYVMNVGPEEQSTEQLT